MKAIGKRLNPISNLSLSLMFFMGALIACPATAAQFTDEELKLLLIQERDRAQTIKAIHAKSPDLDTFQAQINKMFRILIQAEFPETRSLEKQILNLDMIVGTAMSYKPSVAELLAFEKAVLKSMSTPWRYVCEPLAEGTLYLRNLLNRVNSLLESSSLEERKAKLLAAAEQSETFTVALAMDPSSFFATSPGVPDLESVLKRVGQLGYINLLYLQSWQQGYLSNKVMQYILSHPENYSDPDSLIAVSRLISKYNLSPRRNGPPSDWSIVVQFFAERLKSLSPEPSFFNPAPAFEVPLLIAMNLSMSDVYHSNPIVREKGQLARAGLNLFLKLALVDRNIEYDLSKLLVKNYSLSELIAVVPPHLKEVLLFSDRSEIDFSVDDLISKALRLKMATLNGVEVLEELRKSFDLVLRHGRSQNLNEEAHRYIEMVVTITIEQTLHHNGPRLLMFLADLPENMRPLALQFIEPHVASLTDLSLEEIEMLKQHDEQSKAQTTFWQKVKESILGCVKILVNN